MAPVDERRTTNPPYNGGMLIRRLVIPLLIFASFAAAQGRRGRGAASAVDVTVLKPARVFDGETMHEGWMVLVRGDRIDSAGATVDAAGAKVIDQVEDKVWGDRCGGIEDPFGHVWYVGTPITTPKKT